MNVFVGILVLLGFGALVYAGVSWARAGKATGSLAGSIQQNGILASLFPQKGVLPSRAQLLAGPTPAYQNPLVWSGAAKDLTDVGIQIAKAAGAGAWAGSSGGSGYRVVSADNSPQEIVYSPAGPGMSGSEYLARMRNNDGSSVVTGGGDASSPDYYGNDRNID